MLHKLDGTCILKRSDMVQILQILAEQPDREEVCKLCDVLAKSFVECLDGWVAVPYVAQEKQLIGNTLHPISLKRWQSILSKSPEKPFI